VKPCCIATTAEGTTATVPIYRDGKAPKAGTSQKTCLDKTGLYLCFRDKSDVIFIIHLFCFLLAEVVLTIIALMKKAEITSTVIINKVSY